MLDVQRAGGGSEERFALKSREGGLFLSTTLFLCQIYFYFCVLRAGPVYRIMRRYFEFGIDGNPITGTWYEQSNRFNFPGNLEASGQFPPCFVEMPYKEALFEVLTALSSARDLNAIWLIQRDQGVDPDPGCQAQHIPRAYDSLSIAAFQFFANPCFMPWSGYPIFNEDSGFTGNFSGPLLQSYSEPPSENG